ncbi:hypothetical protein SA87_08420 [Hydrogenibacillus schlegelii]|uniref:Uncharacterized protein n=1 Tax=Hydrogenibacillus schlegelii TaxID=1484 RepID=A0A179ISG5_HYDSH|nr:hypothetical protein SA87_08420 [Hydrogenibacillus schlegelii]
MGGHHPSFPSGDMLDRMKTKDRHVSNRPNAPPAIGRPQCMSGIFDKKKTILIGEFAQWP